MKLVRYESEDSDEEKHIHEILRMLRDDFERQAQPYIERLVFIRSIKQPSYFIRETEKWK